MDCFSLATMSLPAHPVGIGVLEGFIWPAGALIAVTQLVAILIYWMAAKIIAPEEATLLNALKTWGYYILGVCGAMLVAGVALYFLRSHPIAGIVTVAGFLILVLTLLFRVPMQIYQISFLPTLGFLAITLILQSASQLFLMKTFAGPETELGRLLASRGDPAQIQRIFRNVAPVRPQTGFDESVVADPDRSLPERHAALQQIHRELQTRHAALKKDDAKAIQAYQRDQARYDQLVREITAASRR